MIAITKVGSTVVLILMLAMVGVLWLTLLFQAPFWMNSVHLRMLFPRSFRLFSRQLQYKPECSVPDYLS